MARYFLTQLQGPFLAGSNILLNEIDGRQIDRIAIHLAEDAPLEWIASPNPIDQAIVTLQGQGSILSKSFIIGKTGLLELEEPWLNTVKLISFDKDMPAATLVDLWISETQS